MVDAIVDAGIFEFLSFACARIELDFYLFICLFIHLLAPKLCTNTVNETHWA